MSGVEESFDITMCCASCGIGQVDDIKLKKCTACYLVRYCSVKCQKEHRPQHKRACKKRAAELRDEILFKQPESSDLGDCPICFLPLAVDNDTSTIMACCSKKICNGCAYANREHELEGKLEERCPFCRYPVPDTEDEGLKNHMKRVEANDPVAMCQMGWKFFIDGDYKSSFLYWTKAARLGNAESHYQLSRLYREGEGVEKDKKKELHHLEEAAICGHPNSRHNLGCIEGSRGEYARATKHLIIAAKLGFDPSLELLKENYVNGHVSKEDFAGALRAHQAAVDATKSVQREVGQAARSMAL